MMTYFYKDKAEMILKEELLTSLAKNWAISFISPKAPSDKKQKNPPMNSTQLRKFHNEAKELEERVKNEGFDKVRPLVKMLKAKVAYDCPSNGFNRKIPLEFRKYIEEMVDNIEDAHDFKGFCLCFEAVVGFFYGEGGRVS